MRRPPRPLRLAPGWLALLALGGCAASVTLPPPDDRTAFLYGTLDSGSARYAPADLSFERRGDAVTPFSGRTPATRLTSGEFYAVVDRPGRWLFSAFTFAGTGASPESMGCRPVAVDAREIVDMGSWKLWPIETRREGVPFSRGRFLFAPDRDRPPAAILERLLAEPRLAGSPWGPLLRDRLERLRAASGVSGTAYATPGLAH